MTRDIAIRLESAVSRSFRCMRAADSLDIDVEKKSVHELHVAAVDVVTPYNVGLIVGASGSGKSTLARELFGPDWGTDALALERPVLEQFPEAWDYDACAAALAGVGLTSVPCWIRPALTLSTGQRARADAALQMALQLQGRADVPPERGPRDGAHPRLAHRRRAPSRGRDGAAAGARGARPMTIVKTVKSRTKQRPTDRRALTDAKARAKLLELIDRSQLSKQAFARSVLLRPGRTLYRWLDGDVIPLDLRAWLARVERLDVTTGADVVVLTVVLREV